VTCPNGQRAVGIIPTWTTWNTSLLCVPVSRVSNNSTVGTDWLGNCSSNSIATMTLCCP
jgi:hypothetical protein